MSVQAVAMRARRPRPIALHTIGASRGPRNMQPWVARQDAALPSD